MESRKLLVTWMISVSYTHLLNGASDLLVEAFGEIGRHSRTAVGVSALPLNVAVEISMVVEAVSYTHLDVYKRQSWVMATMILRRSLAALMRFR